MVGGHLGNATVCGISENIAYCFIKLRAKSHSFNILRTMDVLSCPTISSVCLNLDRQMMERIQEFSSMTGGSMMN